MRYGKDRGRMPGRGTVRLAPCRRRRGRVAPEFAYTAEQWASLRDNQLDFTEIADLIHVVQ